MTLINYVARVPKHKAFNPAEAYDAKALADEYMREYNDQVVRFLEAEPDDDRVIDATEEIHNLLSSYSSLPAYASEMDRALSDGLWDAISGLAYARGGSFDDRSVQGLYEKLGYILNRARGAAEEIAEALIKSAVSGSGLDVWESTLDFNIAGELDAVDLVDALKKLDNTCPGLLEELQVDFHIIDSDFKFDDPAWIRSRPSL